MWTEFAARLRAFVARRLPPEIDPDDVVQEVFLRVVRHLPSLRKAERVESWLFQIARNAIRDAMRTRRRRDSRTEPLDIDVPAVTDADDDAQDEKAVLAMCLAAMVTRLPEPYRTAIALTSEQGLTQGEAARRAGVSVSGMKSRVQRAREQLKAMLLRCCEIGLDRRRGVSDVRPREAAVCAGVRPARNRGVSGSGAAKSGFAAIHQETDMNETTRTQDPRTAMSGRRAAAPSACCGGPAPAGADACCARDAEAKSGGGAGCGCGPVSAAPAPRGSCCPA